MEQTYTHTELTKTSCWANVKSLRRCIVRSCGEDKEKSFEESFTSLFRDFKGFKVLRISNTKYGPYLYFLPHVIKVLEHYLANYKMMRGDPEGFSIIIYKKGRKLINHLNRRIKEGIDFEYLSHDPINYGLNLTERFAEVCKAVGAKYPKEKQIESPTNPSNPVSPSDTQIGRPVEFRYRLVKEQCGTQTMPDGSVFPIYKEYYKLSQK